MGICSNPKAKYTVEYHNCSISRWHAYLCWKVNKKRWRKKSHWDWHDVVCSTSTSAVDVWLAYAWWNAFFSSWTVCQIPIPRVPFLILHHFFLSKKCQPKKDGFRSCGETKHNNDTDCENVFFGRLVLLIRSKKTAEVVFSTVSDFIKTGKTRKNKRSESRYGFESEEGKIWNPKYCILFFSEFTKIKQ